MTKLSEIIYKATCFENDPYKRAKLAAAAVIPLIEKAAIDAGTEHGGWDGFEDWWNEWLSENITCKADKKETE